MTFVGICIIFPYIVIEGMYMCTISCKAEDNVKKDSELIFEAMGISMSAAINTKLVKTFAGLVEERIKEAEEDANLSPVFSSMEEAKDWLES